MLSDFVYQKNQKGPKAGLRSHMVAFFHGSVLAKFQPLPVVDSYGQKL